jgi:hypothetical protein
MYRALSGLSYFIRFFRTQGCALGYHILPFSGQCMGRPTAQPFRQLSGCELA